MAVLNFLKGKELKSLRIEENDLIIELISSEIFKVNCKIFTDNSGLQPQLRRIKIEKFTKYWPENEENPAEISIDDCYPVITEARVSLKINTKLLDFYVIWLRHPNETGTPYFSLNKRD